MSFEKWICTHCGAINPNRSYECHNCRNNGNYERIVIQGQRNMNTIDRLIELASKATPGPWACEDEFEVKTQVEQRDGDRPSFPTIAICTRKYRGYTYEVSDTFASANAEFIAMANPETVKRLCELLKEAKKLIPYVAASENISFTVINESLTWINKFEQLENGSGE